MALFLQTGPEKTYAGCRFDMGQLPFAATPLPADVEPNVTIPARFLRLFENAARRGRSGQNSEPLRRFLLGPFRTEILWRGFAADETPIGLSKTGERKEENLMAEFTCASTRRSSNCSSPTTCKAPACLPVILAVTVLALAGCNANQGLNPSGQAKLGDIYPNYSSYDPIEYAQTSGFYGGR